MWLFGDIAQGDYAGTWTRWSMGSIGGVLVVTPFALAWGAGDPLPRDPRYWAHLLACVVVTSLVCAWVFLGAPSALPRTWVVWPVLLWSSLAFGVRGATMALLPATLISVAGTMMGTGVLGLTLEPSARHVLLQQFLTAASLTCLVLAVVADERRGKQVLHDREQRLHLALAAAHSFGFEHEVESGIVTRTSECADILGLPAAQAERGTARAFIAHVDRADQEQLDQALKGLTPEQPGSRLSYRFHRPDGRIVDIDESYTATFDVTGRPVRIVGVAVDLADVVADAVLAVTPAAAARHVAVHLDRPAGAVLVSGDPERLQQVFWNLLVNAVKFTEPGGTIHIRVDAGEDGQQRVRVTDTGKGIAADFLPHVFDRFRQADGSTTRRHSGLGIGLALVRQLVEMHGGTVRADSEGEGLGATFTVQLAALRATASVAPSETTPLALQAPSRNAVTVLVVDDDQDAREIAMLFLEGSGARVFTAASADEGLRLLQRERPDVLVADIGMPGTDGYAFIRQVRSLPPGQGAETPAVALTALVRDEDRRRALDAGYQSHLAKPVSCDALLATVSRLHPPRSRA
jgi:CheY-like chemotaxis protein/PAS domain-containing protein